ncbi:MAG: hypothetical protein KBT27_07395 [Prevotellaceae bacterium]|nr:hypothetical protein [Candidatus Faecinaster equi]
MDKLEYIFHYAVSSMFIGVVLTILGIIGFFLLIKGWYKDRTFNRISLVIGVVLFLLLCIQNILLCGTIHIIRMSDMLENRMTEYVQPYVKAGDDYMERNDVDDLLFKGLANDYPIIFCYVGVSDFRGFRASEIPHVTIDTLNEYCYWYIARRIGWSLLFVIIGAVIVIKTMERNYTKRTLSRQYSHTSNRNERILRRTQRR